MPVRNRVPAVQFRASAAVSLLLLLFLTACGARVEQEVTFLRDEAWRAEMSFELGQESMAMLEALGSSLEREMDDAVAEMTAEGIDAEWERQQDGDVTRYVIKSSGQGHDLLNEVAFNNRAVIRRSEADEDAIDFSYNVSRDLLEAEFLTIRLVGGRILSSNGEQLNRSTVQWVQPRGQIEATLTERSGFLGNGLLIGALLVGLVVAGGGLALYRRRGAGVTYCAQCGHEMGPQAQFCPGCGAPRL